MKKSVLATIAIVLSSIAVVVFIYISNDHLECDSSTVVTYGDHGEKITTNTHICKEIYNL